MPAEATTDKAVFQEVIDAYLKEHLADYLSEFERLNEARRKELSLIERIVRVEEELRHLREIEMVRHEALMKEMSTRFEAVNARFEALEKRLSFIQWLIGTGIALTTLFATLAPFIYRKILF